MADTSNLTNYLRDVAKAIKNKKGTTDPILAANFDIEIETINVGVDTSDATATSSDIASGKTAYVNGEKIEGNVFDARDSGMSFGSANLDGYFSETNSLQMTFSPPFSFVIDETTTGVLYMDGQTIAQRVGLTSDKIVSGNTILGVEGTGIKQFSTIDEMNADTTKAEGDLAVVYGHRMAPFALDRIISEIVCPKNVVIDPPTRRPAWSIDFDCPLGEVRFTLSDYSECTLSITQMDMMTGSDKVLVHILWRTSDMKSYTLEHFMTPDVPYTEDIGSLTEDMLVVNFGGNISNIYMTSDDEIGFEYMSQFMLIDDGYHLDGLYKCSSELQYELADTQYTSTASEVVSGTSFYGANGIEVGTLGDDVVSPTLVDASAQLYSLLQQQYDTLNLVGADGNITAGISNSVSIIPNKSDGTSILNTSAVTSMYRAFYNWENLLVGPNINTSNVTNTSYMFYGAEKLSMVPLYDTSKVTNMSYMFAYSGIRDVPLFDTSSVTNMQYMFSSCDNLVTAPALNMSNVTSIYRMFSSCYSLYNIPQYDWSKVTNVRLAFQHSSYLTDESLNNIMASLLTSPAISTLDDLGFGSDLITRCHSLSNYQALIDKGWTDS